MQYTKYNKQIHNILNRKILAAKNIHIYICTTMSFIRVVESLIVHYVVSRRDNAPVLINLAPGRCEIPMSYLPIVAV